MFIVVRHPDIEEPGIVPEGVLEMHRGKGWFRVSDPRPEPSDFNLPDFADAPDLDAPEPTESAAEPEQDEEQEA